MTHHRWHRCLVLAIVLCLAAPAGARAASLAGARSPRIAGTATDFSGVTLTVAGATGRARVSLCYAGWCWFTGGFWTLAMDLTCGKVEGRTWYGGAWALDPVEGEPYWWSFTVVDGVVGHDAFAFTKVLEPQADGACGARELAAHTVLAGDFRIVRAT